MQRHRKKNNETHTACTIAALRFGMQLPEDSLYIETSATAIFRVDLQHRLRCTYYHYYYYIVWIRAIVRRTHESVDRP